MKNILSQVIEQSLNEIYIVDFKTNKFVYANESAIKNLGYSLEELSHMSPFDITPIETHTSAEKRLEALDPSNEDTQKTIINSIHVRKNGSQYPVELHGHITQYYDRPAYIAFALDLSETKSNLNLLNAIVKGANIGYWRWDIKLDQCWVSNEWLNIIGYPHTDCHNSLLSWTELVHPDDKHIAIHDIPTRLNEHDSYLKEFRIKHKKGHYVWVEASGTVLSRCPKTLEALTLCGTHTDITKRKTLLLDLRTSEEMYRSLAEYSGDAIMRYNREHQHIYANPAIENLIGLPMDSLLGKTHEEIGYPPHLCKIWHDSIEKVFVTGEPNSVIFETEKQGEQKEASIIDWRVFPELNSKGQIESVISVARDITHSHKAEQELQKMHKLDSLGILAGGIAHDFNNILTILFGNITLTKHALSQDHPAFETINKAETAFHRAKQLTNQLLTFAKGGDPVKQDISINTLIDNVVRFDLLGSNVKLIFEPNDDIWLANVDSSQITQVFSNLATNANQAMPNGGHLYIDIVNSRIVEDEVIGLEAGDYLKFTVKDEGEGIDSDNLNQIFDPYFSTRGEGRGLGLATVFSIINRHGGHISAHSLIGIGTTFTLYLPASNQQSSNLYDDKIEANKQQDIKVLIMDDEDMILSLAERALSSKGYAVETALDGQEAFEKYKDAFEKGVAHDCIIMDLTIPGGMGGEETLKKILLIDPNVKAIVSSGYAVDSVMANYQDYGFKAVISKPFTLEKLFEVVYQVVDKPV